MKKYVGKYRVDVERCSITGDEIENSNYYLRCIGRNKGGKVYRYDENTLVVYVASSVGKGKNMIEDMKELGVEVIKTLEYADEIDIYINESDLDKVADIIGITENGAKIAPNSIKNHPRRDEIRQEKKDNWTDEEKEKYRLLGEKLKSFRENDNK